MDSIKSLNLEPIIHALVAREGWRLKDAQEVAGLYRNYLMLTKKYPEKKLPPSEDVDEFWHMHVLHTAQYRSDCEAIFGAYLDHVPELGQGPVSQSSSAGMAEAQALHFQEFGDYIYEVRGRFQKLVSVVKKLIRG